MSTSKRPRLLPPHESPQTAPTRRPEPADEIADEIEEEEDDDEENCEDEEEVSFTGEVTREEKDAIGRANAVSLLEDTPVKPHAPPPDEAASPEEASPEVSCTGELTREEKDAAGKANAIVLTDSPAAFLTPALPAVKAEGAAASATSTGTSSASSSTSSAASALSAAKARAERPPPGYQPPLRFARLWHSLRGLPGCDTEPPAEATVAVDAIRESWHDCKGSHPLTFSASSPSRLLLTSSRLLLAS